MIVHQIFAQIVDKTIKNVIVCDNYELANQLARLTYGEKALARECTQYPVSIGDKFVDGIFVFKDGITPIPKKNTAEEDAQEAQAKIELLNEQQVEAAVEIDFRLCLIELGLLY